MPGFSSDRQRGIVSVCLVQYNQYGNAINGPTGFVEREDGTRIPRLLAEGCGTRHDLANFGEYTREWSMSGTWGSNNSKKDYADVAIKNQDGVVRVFCVLKSSNTIIDRDGVTGSNMPACRA